MTEPSELKDTQKVTGRLSPSEMSDRGRRSQIGKARLSFSSSVQNIDKFVTEIEPTIETLESTDLSKILIELNVYRNEFTDSFNRIEYLTLEPEIIQKEDVALYDKTAEKILGFQRKLQVRKDGNRKDLLTEDRADAISQKTGSHRSTRTQKSNRRRTAILESSLADMKFETEKAKQEAKIIKLQNDKIYRRKELEHTQHLRNLELKVEYLQSKLKAKLEAVDDEQLDEVVNTPEILINTLKYPYPDAKDFADYDDNACNLQATDTTLTACKAQATDTTLTACKAQATDTTLTSCNVQATDTTLTQVQLQQFTPTLKSDNSNPLTEVEKLGQLMARTTLPPLKPIIFTGDRLNYQKWRSSFRVCFEKRTDDPEELLGYLSAYTSGEPHKMISSKLHSPSTDNFQKAMKQLQDEFGNPIAICEDYIKHLESREKVEANDALAFKDYANFLENCFKCLKSFGYTSKLNDASVIKIAMDLLPKPVKTSFREEIQRKFRDFDKEPTFDFFVNFVKRKAKALGDPVFGEPPRPKSTNTSSHNRPTQKTDLKTFRHTSHSTGTNEAADSSLKTTKSITPRCLYCTGDHWLEHCGELRKKPTQTRKDFLTNRRFCFHCTMRGHEPSNCPNKGWKTCKMCNQKGHISLFHPDNTLNPGAPSFKQTRVNSTSSSKFDTKPSKEFGDLAHVTLGYVRHRQSPDDMTQVYIYSDSEADTCFIQREFALERKWTGPDILMELTTMHGTDNIECQRITDLEIINYNGTEVFDLPVCYTRDSLPISRHLPEKQLKHFLILNTSLMKYQS